MRIRIHWQLFAVMASVLGSSLLPMCRCAGGCEEHVIQSDGSVTCYSLRFAEATWNYALSECRLPIIQSAAENAAISQLMQNGGVTEAWIGAKETRHPWQWLDGTELSYQGCYDDHVTDGAVQFSHKVTLNDNSPQNCVDECVRNSFNYAALHAGNECWCGSSFSRHGQSGAPCSQSCPGQRDNMTMTCGGPSAIDVYSTSGFTASGSYSNWVVHQPFNGIGNIDCAVLEMSQDGATIQWQDYACSYSNFGALCDLGPATASECDGRQSTSFVVGDRCVDVINDVMTQFQARAACRQRGSRADLVQLKTRSDNDEASAGLKRYLSQNQQRTGFWIGLRQSQWTWHSGVDVTYTNWNAQTPTSSSSVSADQQCTILSRDVTGKWRNVDCSASKYFVCEAANSTLPTSPTTPTRSTTTTSRSSDNGLPHQGSSTTTRPPSSAPQTTTYFTITASDVASSSNGLSMLALIGIIVAAVVVLLVISAVVILVVVVCVCRRKSASNPVRHESAVISGKDDIESPVGSKPFYYFGVTTTDLQKAGESPEVEYATISTPPPDVVPNGQFDMVQPSAPTLTFMRSPSDFHRDADTAIYADCANTSTCAM